VLGGVVEVAIGSFVEALGVEGGDVADRAFFEGDFAGGGVEGEVLLAHFGPGGEENL